MGWDLVAIGEFVLFILMAVSFVLLAFYALLTALALVLGSAQTHKDRLSQELERFLEELLGPKDAPGLKADSEFRPQVRHGRRHR